MLATQSLSFKAYNMSSAVSYKGGDCRNKYDEIKATTPIKHRIVTSSNKMITYETEKVAPIFETAVVVSKGALYEGFIVTDVGKAYIISVWQ